MGNTLAANPQTTPLAVTTSGTALSGVTVTQVTTGSNFACALSNAGAASCWGSDSNEQLGNAGAANPQPTALAVTTTGTPMAGVILTQIGAGNTFGCALGSTGAAYCWGHGIDGDLGYNSVTSSPVPVAVSTSGVLSGMTLTQVSPAGAPFVCALDTFGAAYCWGTNTTGQAGNPDTAVSFLVPVTVAPSQPTTIAAGNTHSCEIDSGKAYCWGTNTYGELGNFSLMPSSVPVAVWTSGVLSGVTLTDITTGTNFSCALSSAGAAYCWGLNTSGQLGNGTLTSPQETATAVSLGAMPAGTILTQITANGASACALASTGAAYCWGAGGSGQLGNSSTPTAQDTPVAVTTSGVLSGLILTGISSGGTSACALASTGAAYCWGAGGSGQLGNGTTTAAQSTAVAVTVTAGVLAGVTLTGISDGGSTVCVLASTGVAFCWGLGTNGQLGNSASLSSSVPVAVTATGVLSGVTVTQLELGSNSACALSAAGLGYCWGGGAAGQLGNGSTTAIQNTAVAVTATGVLTGQTLTQITLGTTFACTLSNTGADFCWGANGSGQDGNPATAVNALVPVAVTAEPTMISSGYEHACLLRDGKAYCWGDDSQGELGNNSTTTPVSTPVAVTEAGGATGIPTTAVLIQIVTANLFTCALASTGAAYCWGADSKGQLGNGLTAESNVPYLVTGSGSGSLTFTQITVGTNFACALNTAGVAYCWGANPNGQMGDNTGGVSGDTQPTPTAVTVGSPSAMPTGTVLTQISAGYGYTCALASTGAAYCWGADNNGQLGNNSTTQTLTAVAVSQGTMPTGTVLIQIADTVWTPANDSTCALSSAGAAYCWGDDTDGELGNNSTTTPVLTPVAVSLGAMPTGTTLAQITVGSNFACALSSVGIAYCWGLGTGDQLGNGGTTSSSVPVAVSQGSMPAGTTLFQISSGQLATCTQDTTGTFYCWGTNTQGELGNASTTSSTAPVTVAGIAPGPPTGVSAVAGNTSAAISWTAPTSFGTAGAATGYTATATSASGGTFTCSSATPTTLNCTINGLTNGILYTVTVITQTSDGNSVPSTSTTVTPAGLSLTSPTSLTWVLTGTGLSQSTVDSNAADEQFTVGDTLTAGWNILVSATTFTAGSYTAAEHLRNL